MHSTVLAEGVEGSECAVGDIILAFVEPGDNDSLYDLQNLKFIKKKIQIVQIIIAMVK